MGEGAAIAYVNQMPTKLISLKLSCYTFIVGALWKKY